MSKYEVKQSLVGAAGPLDAARATLRQPGTAWEEAMIASRPVPPSRSTPRLSPVPAAAVVLLALLAAVLAPAASAHQRPAVPVVKRTAMLPCDGSSRV